MAAEEEDLELDVASKKGGSKLKLIIIAGVAAIALIGAAVAATLIFSGALSNRSASSAATDKAAATPAGTIPKPAHYLALDPPFVVNFQDKGAMRFLQISVEVMSRDAAVIEQVKQHSPAIRNSLVILFSSQKSDVVSSVEGKEQLRSQTQARINEILKHETGTGGVDAVYFTSFVMQ